MTNQKGSNKELENESKKRKQEILKNKKSLHLGETLTTENKQTKKTEKETITNKKRNIVTKKNSIHEQKPFDKQNDLGKEKKRVKSVGRKQKEESVLVKDIASLKETGHLDKKEIRLEKTVTDQNNKQSVDKHKRKFFARKGAENKLTKKGSSKEREKENKKPINNNEKKELSLTMDIFDILILVIVTAICSCVITGFVLNSQYKKNNPFYSHSFSSNSQISEFVNIYSEVLDNFYEEVDEKGLVDAAINGMMTFLEDNYSIYMNKEDSESLEESLEGSYEGIGVIAYGNLIYSVIPNSPAEQSGLKEGDLITKIEEIVIDETNFNSVADIIGSCEGNIHLVVLREEEEIEFEIEKATVIMQVVEGQILKKNDKSIGYIKLSDFSANSSEQFSEVLLQLEEEGFESLVIDLRGNTGGYLNKATDISSLFLEKGQVIYSLENKNGVTEYKDKTKEKRSYPIVVLINESTASAAEILTVALKDSYGATLVGKKSYGKGKVQNIIHNEDSLVKYTSAKWLRPNGDCIDTVGIQPDYDVNNVMKENIIYDKQLEKAFDLLAS